MRSYLGSTATDMADDPALFNSGGPYRTLEEARIHAQARARVIGRAVGLYEHVGGVHPKNGRVAALGHVMWRDLTDAVGTPYGTPKFVWQHVETVPPPS